MDIICGQNNYNYMLLISIIFGMNLAELFTFLGILVTAIISVGWINVKLSELNIKTKD